MAETTHQFRAETCKLLNILTHSLYTNHEIFLRELLSNASDALEKVRFLQTTGGEVRDPELPLEIRITTDKDNHVITVADTGIGMTEQEMIDNLGTIARSGSEEFPKRKSPPKSPGLTTRKGKSPSTPRSPSSSTTTASPTTPPRSSVVSA